MMFTLRHAAPSWFSALRFWPVTTERYPSTEDRRAEGCMSSTAAAHALASAILPEPIMASTARRSRLLRSLVSSVRREADNRALAASCQAPWAACSVAKASSRAASSGFADGAEERRELELAQRVDSFAFSGHCCLSRRVKSSGHCAG